MILKSVVAITALKAAAKRLGITFAAETLLSDPAVKQLGITASPSYSRRSLAIELGAFLEFFGNFYTTAQTDDTGAFDECLLEFFKTLTDDYSLADEALWAFSKVVSDNPTVTDSEIFNFYKALADNTRVADSNTIHFGKLESDLASIVDSEYIAFSKALAETPSATDLNTLEFFKHTQEEAAFTDAETLEFVKFLSDNVNATDDVDGAASILDDQEMQYFKNLTNIADITDTFVRVVSYTREYSDIAIPTDSEVFHVGKGMLEENVFTDDIDTVEFGKDSKDTAAITSNVDKFDFGKGSADETIFTDDSTIDSTKSLLDTSSEITDEHSTLVAKLLVNTADLTEQQAYDLAKELGENIASTIDDEYRSFNKARSSASAVADNIDTLAFFKNTQDVTNLTDAETLEFVKFLTDTVSVTDDVDGAASILDDQEMQYFKSTVDVSGVTDEFIRVAAYKRSFTDSSSTSEDEVIFVGKNVINVAGTIDATDYAFSKSLTNTASTRDVYVLSIFKVLLENPIVSDDDVLSIGKNLTGSAAELTDSYDFAVAKILLENLVLGEQYTQAFAKELGANIADALDRVYKTLVKSNVELPVAMSDTDVLTVFKNVQDTTGMSDGEVLDFTKNILDIVGVTDDVDGAASILDDQEMQYFKSTVDVSGVTDTLHISVFFVRSFTDITASTDTDSYLLNKVKNSSGLISDLHTVNFGKLLTETPVIGENLALNVTLAPFVNSLSVSELANIEPNKVILNSTSMTDTGSLRSQSYADFTFFAEDYVGASRNF